MYESFINYFNLTNMKIFLDPFKVDGRFFEYNKTIDGMGKSYYLHIPFLTVYWQIIKK